MSRYAIARSVFKQGNIDKLKPTYIAYLQLPDTITDAPLPSMMNFGCSDAIFSALLEQELQAPVGAVYNYSDLSFVSLAFIVGSKAIENR